MLTRLQVKGFKNLVDVDVHFGPFTCVAGANGVGKSNLFDAICFLSALADRPLTDAALSVRDEGRRSTGLRGLFFHVGDTFGNEMSFDAEMIIPQKGYDDLGQKATTRFTFLRYGLTLARRQSDTPREAIQLTREELITINNDLAFDTEARWRESAIIGTQDTLVISTENSDAEIVINLHREDGEPQPRLAANLPRTVLSATNAAENPTALLARREMQSWRLLQLEPSALRQSDEFTAPTQLAPDGSHLASTLYHLAHSDEPEAVYQHLTNKLTELIDDVHGVWIDSDDRRELWTLNIIDQQETSHTARALSDGTLRFLALAILDLDTNTEGVICLEEPENGIHPQRIPAMLSLLQDIATDTTLPIDSDNPLRQVIVNTHSPAVVQQVPDDSLLVAERKPYMRDNQRFNGVQFSYLPDTWRARLDKTKVTAKGQLLAYLNPIMYHDTDGQRRVIDRKDLQPYLPNFEIVE
jgi:predicted ATPase